MVKRINTYPVPLNYEKRSSGLIANCRILSIWRLFREEIPKLTLAGDNKKRLMVVKGTKKTKQKHVNNKSAKGCVLFERSQTRPKE